MRHLQPSQRVLRQVQLIVVSLSLILSPLSPAFAANASVQAAKPALNARNFVSIPHFASVTTMLLKLRAWWQGGSNLDTMRNSSPSLPNSYQQIGSLPGTGYDDPKPSNTSNYDNYLTQLAARGNATGVAGGIPMQTADPTAGSAVVGGWSYNLDSGNYNFTLPVLGLAGRAGLGVSLGLSYNSKVWTKDPNTNTMVFNGDRGLPAPGWNIGFGAIQIKDLTGAYYNSGTGAWSIIYIAPDGTRHDLALVPGTSNFKSYDSSYLVFDAAAQVMSFPNGAKVKYGAYSYDTNVRDYQALPIEVKDRNGNYVTISYKDLTTSVGTKKVIDYVTDTAGRRIDFNYQNNRLTSVSQNRAGNTFYYVRLDYAPVTIKTRFVSPLVTDPSNINNTDVYFPIRITYPTGVSYRFSYTSYGQINTFQKWVPGVSGQGDERPIAQTALVGVAHCIDLNAPENSPNYCNPIANLPSFFQRQEKAEGWMGATASNWATAPFQTYQYYGTDIYDPTGRRFLVQTNGMTQTVSIFAPNAGSFTKKEEETYASDSGVSYLSNLRVIETKNTAMTDGVPQIKTTSFTYLQRDGMWLPSEKSENSGYRRTVMEYTSYPSQYILGLQQQVSVYTGSTLLTRVSNSYDETGSFTDSNGQTASYFINATSDGAIQHDDTNYGSSFTSRGNLTSSTQYSVVGGSVTVSRIAKRVSYDTNGNVRAETDAAGNRKQIEYADNYSNKPAGVGPTFAYAYTTADPTGFRAGAQWNYFTGQTIKSFNLLAGSSTEQQAVTTSYDFADRPSQTTRPDGGWVKTAYWDNWLAGVISQQVDSGQVRYKFELSDGAGRKIKSAGDHPDGVSGKYSGQIKVYDNVGQATDSSNLLAVDGNWIPSGEDQGKQFLFTHLTRDELARLKIVTLPDGNTRKYDYSGCGCAGNSETRVSDELGHQTITKTDALSRLIEAIEPNPSATDGIYSKATYIYDALDRLVEIQHRGGYNPNTGAVPTQFRYFSYDGYGRLASENTPEGGVVTYSYTANDQIATRSDGRNISSAYVYNSRNLPASVSYSDGTPTVVYNYDAYGARSSVTDGEGAASYSYNGYRQLQSETRTFTALTGRLHTLNYAYNQADQVRQVNYQVTQSSGLMPDTQETASLIQPAQPAQLVEQPAAVQPPQATLPSRPTAKRRGTQQVTLSNHSISGYVRHAATNQGIAGATVTANRLDDPQQGPNPSVQTSSSGSYFIEDLPDGATYQITVSKSGYAFSPANATFEMTEDKQQDFTGLEYPPTGTLSANPNPIQVCDGSGQGASTLTWSATGVTAVQVRRGAPNGTLVASGGTSGTVNASGITTGTVFYLQNVTGGLPLTSANTLATVTVNTTTQGCPVFSSFNKTVNYAYNSVGTLISVGTNLIGTDASNTSNVLNSATFRASGAVKSVSYGNGRRLTMGYSDTRNQPISMKVDRVNNAADKIIDYQYEYYTTDSETGASVNNNRIRRIVDNVDPGYTTDYYYDNYNRLTNAQAQAYFRYYYYDPFGNITNFSALALNYQTNAYGAPATNRISSDGVGFSYSYDAAGNMTSGMGQTFSYDGANRLKTAGNGNSAYGYDGDGMRVKKTENGATTYYVKSAILGQSVMEVYSQGVLRAYVYSGNKMVAMQATDGQFYWLHPNRLNSSRAMTDVNGNLTYKGQFDPYGQTLSEWSSSANNNLNTRKFTGYERDVSSGLDYAGARMYNSGRGQFTQPDPAGSKSIDKKHPESLNRYAYVEDDPLNSVDPSGKFLADPNCTSIYLDGFYWGNTCGGGGWWGGMWAYWPDYSDGGGDVGDDNQVRPFYYQAPFNAHQELNGYFANHPGCKSFFNDVRRNLNSPFDLDGVWQLILGVDIAPLPPPKVGETYLDDEKFAVILIEPEFISGTEINGTTIYNPSNSPQVAQYKYIKTLIHELMHIEEPGTLAEHAAIVIAATPFLTDAERSKIGPGILKGGFSDQAYSYALDEIVESRCQK